MPDTRRSLSALQTLYADNASGDIGAQDGRDELISSHPEKTTQSAAYASEPSTAQLTGDLFFPTDTTWVERYSGSAWQPWGPLWKVTKPVLGDYTAINSASGSAPNGGIYLSDSAQSGVYQVRAYTKTAPATPWTYTAHLTAMPGPTGTNQYFNCGLCFRQSSDGKLVLFGPWLQSVEKTQLLVDNLNGPTSQVSSPLILSAATFVPGGSPFWLRIADDGTNRLCQVSANGFDWLTVYSVARTTFLTADQLGFFVNTYSSAGGLFLHSLEVG